MKDFEKIKELIDSDVDSNWILAIQLCKNKNKEVIDFVSKLLIIKNKELIINYEWKNISSRITLITELLKELNELNDKINKEIIQ